MSEKSETVPNAKYQEERMSRKTIDNKPWWTWGKKLERVQQQEVPGQCSSMTCTQIWNPNVIGCVTNERLMCVLGILCLYHHWEHNQTPRLVGFQTSKMADGFLKHNLLRYCNPLQTLGSFSMLSKCVFSTFFVWPSCPSSSPSDTKYLFKQLSEFHVSFLNINFFYLSFHLGHLSN